MGFNQHTGTCKAPSTTSTTQAQSLISIYGKILSSEIPNNTMKRNITIVSEFFRANDRSTCPYTTHMAYLLVHTQLRNSADFDILQGVILVLLTAAAMVTFFVWKTIYGRTTRQAAAMRMRGRVNSSSSASS